LKVYREKRKRSCPLSSRRGRAYSDGTKPKSKEEGGEASAIFTIGKGKKGGEGYPDHAENKGIDLFRPSKKE